MKIIDTHTHTFPDHIAAAAIDKLEKKGNIKAAGDGKRTGLLKDMQEAGVDISIVAPVATSTEQVHSINKKSSGLDQSKLIMLGAMYPDVQDFTGELDYIQSIGLKGVKLHPEYQDFWMSDPRLFPLYEELQSRGMILLFHAGEDIGYQPPFKGLPDELLKVSKNFPHLKIIAAHMGGYNAWDGVYDLIAGRKNIWLDTAYCAGIIPDKIFDALVDKHGYENILMATDWPWQSPKKTIDWLMRKKLGSKKLEAILGGNAEKLFEI